MTPPSRRRASGHRRSHPTSRPRLRPTRRGWLVLVVLTLSLAGGVALAGYAYYQTRTGDILHANARFVPEAPPAAPPRASPDRFEWSEYGYTKDHTRYFPTSLRGPFHQAWVHHGAAILEFPPTISNGSLYQLNDNAVLMAINKSNGRVRWRRRLGRLSASTPAASGNSVYATVLARAAGVQEGRVVAVRQSDGTVRWSRALPSRSESSPLLDRGRLYFGTEDGTVFALRASDGSVIWTYHARGAVKASPTLNDGRLYFGDYGGSVHALRQGDGRPVWSTDTSGTLFGSGNFYSTAAVRWGRVFLGSTDGRVYAFDEWTGRLDWAHQTGAYVYASPAALDTPGLGPTLYLGSYDGTFYALNARTGRVRWRYHAGGRISGSATVVGHTVYFADLGQRNTTGLDIRTGRWVFGWGSGSFDPAVSDGGWLYVTGYTGLYALAPPDHRGAPAKEQPAVAPAPKAPAARRAPAPSPARPIPP